MDFASIFSDLEKSKKGKIADLPACRIAAMHRNFDGNGPHKLSKAEIESVNISKVCNDIKSCMTPDNIVNHLYFLLPSQLTFGALRILEKQMDSFQEQCDETLATLMVSNQLKKLPKKKVNELDDDWHEKEISFVDVRSLFRSPKQKYLLPEEDYQLPIDTTIEFNFNDELSTTSQIDAIPTLREGPDRFPEELDNLNETAIPKGTPKRKSRTSHNETPTKRSRKAKDSAPSYSKTAEVTYTSEHLSARRISEPSQSRARRSIFPPDISQEPSAVDVDENLPHGPPEDSAESLQNIPNVANVVEEPMDQSVPQDQEVSAVPQPHMSQEIPADHIVTDNIQRPASVVQEGREDEESMRLSELDDSFIEQSRRKKSRKLVVFDKRKIIDIRENLENPKNPKVHVREATKFKPHYTKVPAKILLSLPSVHLKLETHKDKIGCSWGQALASQFLEMIKTPCPSVIEETAEGILLRNRGIDKRRRYTTFTVPERPTISYTSMDSAKSVQQSVSNVYANADDQPGFQDPMLMPPPQPPINEEHPPFEEVHPPSTPGRETRAQSSPIAQKSLPRTPRLGRMDLEPRVGVSPQQRGRPSGADPPQQEPQPASESPIAAHSVMTGSSIHRSRHSLIRTPDGGIRTPGGDSESMIRIENEKYFMSVEEFGQFLEKIWIVLRNQSSYKQLQFDLRAILVPGESSCKEVVVYFTYLCIYEMRNTLQIKQDKPYGTVSIIKLD